MAADRGHFRSGWLGWRGTPSIATVSSAAAASRAFFGIARSTFSQHFSGISNGLSLSPPFEDPRIEIGGVSAVDLAPLDDGGRIARLLYFSVDQLPRCTNLTTDKWQTVEEAKAKNPSPARFRHLPTPLKQPTSRPSDRGSTAARSASRVSRCFAAMRQGVLSSA